MTPGAVRPELVAERAAWIRQMLDGMQGLPLASYDDFRADPRNVAAAESYLRRALEALLDLGRHLLAKGLGRATSEYKEIADALMESGVLDDNAGKRLRHMAGYRNRLVHIYAEIGELELYEICATRRHEIGDVLTDLLTWTRSHTGMDRLT